MNKFTLDEFNPTVTELETLAKKHSWLKINWIWDGEGYENVKLAKKELQQKRLHITKTLKWFRQEAIIFQKAVIEQEKKLISIIEWTEKHLWSEKERVDEELKIEERRKVLPERMKLLSEKEIEACENDILKMDSNQFSSFVVNKTQEMLDRKEKLLEEERRKVEEEKKKIEDQKMAEQIKKEAEAKAKEDLEEKILAEAEEKKREEEKEKARVEYKKRFAEKTLDWGEYKTEKEDWKIVLYKKVSEFKITS